uniref:Ribosomal protein S19 n=1 Tax=Urostyla grandis TaxID=57509 RepID=A0A2I4PEP2_9SPIT|nr:ribosomal protein S19 [Urostyla grandis]
MNRRWKRKQGFLTLAIWRKLILIQKSFLFHATRKLIFSRSSTIPRDLTNRRTFIHTGRRFKRRFLSKWSIGYKYGSLTWNRRLAIYKAKQMRKKKNKKR